MAAMAEDGPSGVNPFEGMPIFGDLARMFSQQGPVNWDVARQIAHWLATDGQSEPNVEPVERMRFEELLRVAELRVADSTGLATSTTGRVVAVVPMTRGVSLADRTVERELVRERHQRRRSGRELLGFAAHEVEAYTAPRTTSTT